MQNKPNLRVPLLATLFALTFLTRFALAWRMDMENVSTLTEMQWIGVSLASSGDFANPFAIETGPTAHTTPLFPLVLAGVYSIFGLSESSNWVFALLACGLSALRCTLLPLLVLEAGLGAVPAVLTGLISFLYIGALDTEVKGGVDGPYVALALLALIWYALRLWRSGSWQSRSPWGFYLLAGLSALLNPSLLPVLAGIVAIGLFTCAPRHRRRFVQESLKLAGVTLLCLLPWGIRNYLELGSFYLTRDNFGLEFWLSNGPDRTYDLPSNYGNYHPGVNRFEGAQVAALGEAKYNQDKMTAGVNWVRSNPAAFLHLTGKRFVAWWFPPAPNLLIQAGKAALTLAAFIGLFLLYRRQPTLAVLFVATWLVFPLVYYIIQWSSRYRYPMDWQLIVCAAVAVSAVIPKRRSAEPDEDLTTPEAM